MGQYYSYLAQRKIHYTPYTSNFIVASPCSAFVRSSPFRYNVLMQRLQKFNAKKRPREKSQQSTIGTTRRIVVLFAVYLVPAVPNKVAVL